MASETKPSGLDLGFVIAFVAPGFVAFLALSYHVPAANAWMDAASKAKQGVGVFLFVLLASLAMGLIVSGVRALSIDKLLRCPWLLRKFAVPAIAFDWAGLEGKKLPVLLTVRDAYFRHYQFYSNTLVALVLWAVSHATSGVASLSCGQRVVISIGIIALLLSARDSLLGYTRAANQIFKS